MTQTAYSGDIAGPGFFRRPFQAISRSILAFTDARGACTKVVAMSGAEGSVVTHDNLIRAAARSKAWLAVETAASSAAICVASNHATSRAAMPGNTTKRSSSFFRLSRRRTCANSCRRALRNSLAFRTASTASDIRTSGRKMPAAVRAGTTREMRSTGTELTPFTRSASPTHVAIVLEAANPAAVALRLPSRTRTSPHKPKTTGMVPTGSRIAWGSRTINDGTVNVNVTASEIAKGNVRKANSRSAQCHPGYRSL